MMPAGHCAPFAVQDIAVLGMYPDSVIFRPVKANAPSILAGMGNTLETLLPTKCSGDMTLTGSAATFPVQGIKQVSRIAPTGASNTLVDWQAIGFRRFKAGLRGIQQLTR